MGRFPYGNARPVKDLELLVTDAIVVSSSSELYTALAHAQGGDTILLEPGDYGKLVLNGKSGFDITFSGNVTLTSADPENAAALSGLTVDGVANLTFDGLIFDYTFSEGHPTWAKPFTIANSENVTIRNSVFDGDIVEGGSEEDNGYATAYGLYVGGSTGTRIENNEFFEFNRAIVMGGNTDTVVSSNEIHSIRSDGMDFVAMTGIVIENNYIHDFNRSLTSGDHADMIQFWTNGSKTPSTNIVIRGNLLDIGEGDATQSIFMRNDIVDRGFADEEMFYRNVLIENNTIYNAHSNGIVLGEAIGVVIRNNSVLHDDGGHPDGADSSVEIPRISVAGRSTSVDVSHNVTSSISAAMNHSDWFVGSNILVQDQNENADGYYESVFLFSSLGTNEITSLKGGVIDSLNAGSDLTAYDSTVAVSGFNVSETGLADRVFSVQTGTNSSIQLSKLTYAWDFGDGNTAEGEEVAFSFDAPGNYDVSLTVSMDGEVLQSETAVVRIADPRLVSIDDSGRITGYSFGESFFINHTGTAGGVVLEEKGVAASVGGSYFSDLAKADTFRISFGLEAFSTESSGELFRMQNAFIVSVDANGDLLVRLFTAGQPEMRLRTDRAELNNTENHEISIVADSGMVSIIVDGTELTSAELAAPLRTAGNDWLAIGNAWNEKNFVGTVSHFSVAVDADENIWEKAEGIAAGNQDEATAETTSPPQPYETVEATEENPTPGNELNLMYTLSHEEAAQTTGSPISFGRQRDIETSNIVGFSVDFNRDALGGSAARLVWNHIKIGLELVGDGLQLRVATADEGFKSIKIKNLGLNDLESHTTLVLVDGEEDRIQVVLDGEIVLDRQDIDVEMVGAGGREWGWSAGGVWGHDLNGDITEFQLGDQFHFIQNDLLI